MNMDSANAFLMSRHFQRLATIFRMESDRDLAASALSGTAQRVLRAADSSVVSALARQNVIYFIYWIMRRLCEASQRS